MAKNADLLSITSRVEVPFIVAKIAGMSLGVFQAGEITTADRYNHQYVNVTYPNYVKSLTVQKNANGLVNTYKLTLLYAVTEKDDPNLLEKLLSKAKTDRKIVFSYGDYNVPNFIFREEEALITDVTNDMDINNHTLTYVITAVSNSYKASAGKYSFAAVRMRGSDKIKELLFDTKFQLKDLFPGMKSLNMVNNAGFIASDDSVVLIEAQEHVTVIEYIKYVVSCMRWAGDTSVNKSSIYKIAVFDDILSEYGGAYFKVVRYRNSSEVIDSDDLDYMNIDVGYPDKNAIVSFKVTDSASYALLYDYNESLTATQYAYRIGSDGKPDYSSSNILMEDPELHKVTEAEKTWWAKMTSYPVNAKLVIRGLIRNVELLSMIRINVLFYGKKHVHSGIYAINSQQDSVDENGFKTTLTLIRVGGVEL